MKTVFLCNNIENINRIFTERVREKAEISSAVITENTLDDYAGDLTDTEFVFSTWGMPALSSEKIKKYLPALKCVFYAAGTVDYFAKPFLENGIRVFSAAYANGIPVAEYTVAQIVLGLKGYFQSEKNYKQNLSLSRMITSKSHGNYCADIGLIGLGVIGSMVAERLRAFDVNVFAYDPFASAEKAERLGVKLTTLDYIFANCDVISNHLANKPELNDILNYDLFRLMKENAVFINTGRGAQVNEIDLAKALKESPFRTAALDVLKDEDKPQNSPLFECKNAFITPHIAGSIGYEVTRMADFIIDEYERYLKGEQCSGEVTLEKLKYMA